MKIYLAILPLFFFLISCQPSKIYELKSPCLAYGILSENMINVYSLERSSCVRIPANSQYYFG